MQRDPLHGHCDISRGPVSPARRLGAWQQLRRTGSPQHPARAIEEITMIQLHTCVSVHCDQCGDALGSPELEAHYRSEGLALRAATAAKWQAGSGRRLVCSACAPILTCELEGHQLSAWRLPVLPDGLAAVSEYRYCRRCCELESRPATRRGHGGVNPDERPE
jgi:hypothetical protein